MKGATAFGGGYFGPGSGPTYMYAIYCSGWETSLLSCSSDDEIGVNNCGHGMAAGVSCAGAIEVNCKHIYKITVSNHIFNCFILHG